MEKGLQEAAIIPEIENSISHLSMSLIHKEFKPFRVDFARPWHLVFSKVIPELGLVTVFNLYRDINYALLPVSIGYILSSEQYYLFWYLLGYFLGERLINVVVNHYWLALYNKVAQSVQTAAEEKIMQVDPLYHSTKSSGQIISVIQRGVMGFENLIEAVTENLLSVLIKFFTGIAALYVLGHQTMLVFGISILGVIGLSIYVVMRTILKYQAKENQYIDDHKAAFVENITQFQHIRSTYSTQAQLSKSRKLFTGSRNIYFAKWRTFNLHFQLVGILYYVVCAGVVYKAVQGILAGSVSPEIATGVVIAFIANSVGTLWVGYDLRSLFINSRDAHDMFTFLKNFGKQSFPV